MATRSSDAGGTSGGAGGAGRAGAKTTTGTKAANTGAGAKKKPAGTRGGAKKAAGAASGAAAKKPGSRGGRAGGGTAGGSAKLRADLRGFVQAHPGGWGHNEWIGLVNLLKERGHDTSDTDAIGMALERERLTLVLERVPGLGAQRVKAIADKYPRIWNVMQAGAEELAVAANLPKAVAKKVKDALS